MIASGFCVERLGPESLILREDKLLGGGKMRFLPALVGDAREVVFGGPFCGMAPVALSFLAKALGIRATLFYAARAELHPNQKLAERNGANLQFVRPGYMTVVQKRAKDYAAEAGALFLPLGFDLPAAAEPFGKHIAAVRASVGDIAEVWCACGSGMLTRHLARGFPNSEIHAVAVGLASRHSAQDFPENVAIRPTHYRFEQESKQEPPLGVSMSPNYERKAYEQFLARGPGRPALFWNIA